MIKLVFLIVSFLSFTHTAFAEKPDDVLSLAFDLREIVAVDKPAISPNGQIIALSIRQRPAKINLSKTQLSDGTPNESVGSRIYLLDVNTQKTYEMDPAISGDCWRPSWSPDGLKLAFYSNANGFVQLWIYDLSNNASKKVSDLPIKSSLFCEDMPSWSPDGKTIYVPLDPSNKNDEDSFKSNEMIGKTYSSNEQKSENSENDEDVIIKYYSSHLAAIDVNTGTENILVTNNSEPAPGFLKLSPSGKWLSYLSRPIPFNNVGHDQYDLGITSAREKGNIISIEKVLGAFFFDGCYIWHPFLDILVYIKEGKLYSVVFDDKNKPIVKQIHENSNIKFIGKPLIFNQEGTAVIVGANPSEDLDPQTLFIIPLDSKEKIKEIQLENWLYIDVLKANPSQIWQPQESTLTTLLQDIESGERAIIRFNYDQSGEYTVLWKGVAKISNFISGNKSNDIFFQYEDFNTPPSLYRANQDFTRFDRISSIDLRLENLKFFTYEVYETIVPLYNGELKKVQTTVFLPEGAKRGDRLPGIVAIYPGSDVSKIAREFSGGNLVSIPNFLFLNRDYALILPNIILGPEGTAGDPVQEIVDILLPQIYQAAHLGYVDIKKLGLIGQSYGGYGTAATISRTNLFRAAVAISGTYDLSANYGYFDEHLTIFNSYWSEHGQGRMGKHPWENLFRYMNNSPYYLADHIHTPLMLIHGEEDETCHVIEAKKLFSALKRLEREVHLTIYPGQGHVICEWIQPSAIDASLRILNFFDEHLKSSQL